MQFWRGFSSQRNPHQGESSNWQRRRLESKDLPSVRRLGEGLSGFLYETTWNGSKYVRKDFPLGSVHHDVFEKEAIALLDLEHPNIVMCSHYTVGKSSCSLLLQYVDDDLQNFIQKRIDAQGKGNRTGSSTDLHSRVLNIDETRILMSSKAKGREIAGADVGLMKMPENELTVPFALPEALDIILQIATGVQYLHDKGIVHGGLKPKNVLVGCGGIVKLVDFGFLETKKRIKLVSKHRRHLEILIWKAPELFTKLLGPVTKDSDDPFTDSDTDEDEDEEVESSVIFTKSRLAMADVYSFGLICSQILGGKLKYSNLSLTQLREQRMHGFRPQLPPSCPNDLQFLIFSSVERDPWCRPTFTDICTALKAFQSMWVPLVMEAAPNTMNDSSSFNAPQANPGYSNPSSQASSPTSDDHELRRQVTRLVDDLNASDTSHASSSSHESQQDSPDETGRKTLGSYYLKTAIRMLTDYVTDLKTSNVSIDDSVQSRIEEYEALLHELEEKQQGQDDSKTILATQDRGKLVSMLLDYQAVLLSEAMGDQAQLSEDVPDRAASNAQDTEYTELRSTNEVGEDSEPRIFPLDLSDTDFQEGGYKGPLTGSLALCENQVHKFVSLLPSVVIFKHLCKYVVESLTSRARLNFVQYRKILPHLQEVEGGGEISSSLRNSASFCFESLVGLARRFDLVADLLTKCGGPDWHKSALELANVRPSKHKLRWSEFSLAIRNCEWSMDLVELAFHALQKLHEEGRYSVKDATFKWLEEEGRMVLQILSDREIDRQNSVNQESSKLQEVCRDLEEKDLTDLIEKLEKLMASEKEKKSFYRGTSSPYEIAKYLSNKLSGPTPVAGAYLPYTFTKIDWTSLKYREYLDIGSSGMVAIHDWHEVQVAVKSVRCPIRAKFEEEAAILGMVQHPNVVHLIGCGYIDKSDTGLLVMELMDHDLRYIINSRLEVLPEGSNPFAPIVAIDIMLQIGQAMLYLREHGILHRDLKAKNILVNLCKPLALEEADSANTSLLRQYPAVSAVLPHTQENYVAKLADFGLAKCRSQSSYVNTTMVGTTGWRAPEVFNSTESEGYKWPADVYSFGMLCYEIWTGKMPFEDEPDRGVGLHAKIMAGVRPPLASLLRPDVPDGLRELIQQCWATNAAERPTFETVVKKLWECKVQVILSGFERQIMRTASSTAIT